MQKEIFPGKITILQNSWNLLIFWRLASCSHGGLPSGACRACWPPCFHRPSNCQCRCEGSPVVFRNSFLFFMFRSIFRRNKQAQYLSPQRMESWGWILARRRPSWCRKFLEGFVTLIWTLWQEPSNTNVKCQAVDQSNLTKFIVKCLKKYVS